MTENVREACDNRLVTVLVLLDFSKEVDIVDRGILLRKLKELNFSVCWQLICFLLTRSDTMCSVYCRS